MKQHLLIFGIVALLVTVEFSGCTEVRDPLNTEKNKFVGNWKLVGSDDVTLIFYSNGTNVYSVNETDTTVKGTWEINDGTFTNTLYGFPRTFTYSFSDNDKTLTLIGLDGGEVTVFEKQ